jgi:Ku70/Ku80 beta-barrel domain
LSSLKDWHQLRPASFLYPAERARPGSTTAFIALHEALLAKEAFALCALTRTRTSESRLVACLPQQELVDESGVQARYPGPTPVPPLGRQLLSCLCLDAHLRTRTRVCVCGGGGVL